MGDIGQEWPSEMSEQEYETRFGRNLLPQREPEKDGHLAHCNFWSLPVGSPGCICTPQESAPAANQADFTESEMSAGDAKMRETLAESASVGEGQYTFDGKPQDSECFYGFHSQCHGCNCSCHKAAPISPIDVAPEIQHLSRIQRGMSLVELNLRRRVHNVERHNQWFERCESPWCNPGPDCDPALESHGDRARFEHPNPKSLDVLAEDAPIHTFASIREEFKTYKLGSPEGINLDEWLTMHLLGARNNNTMAVRAMILAQNMLLKAHNTPPAGNESWATIADAIAMLKSAPSLSTEGAALPISEYTFSEFQNMNIERCRKAFPMCDDWTMNDWGVALGGEVGELLNLLKKDRRGLATDERFDLDGPFHELATQNVLSELADIITYADLMISLLSADTAEVVLEKFNEVSKRVGYLPAAPLPDSKEGR